MCKKIIIFGFPHTGTTILRSIMGHIEQVYEIVDETDRIPNNIDCTNYDFVLCKYPYLLNEAEFETIYADYIKLFIMRNPLYVFTSLNQRFKKSIPVNHSINSYIHAIKAFHKFSNNNNQNNNIKNLYLIKYEDMFDNNYEKLKTIFNAIGLKYDNHIFDNSKYTNNVQFGKHVKLPTTSPNPLLHTEYRLFQINQSFVNNNDENNINLTEEQCAVLTTDENILAVYPQNKTFSLYKNK